MEKHNTLSKKIEELETKDIGENINDLNRFDRIKNFIGDFLTIIYDIKSECLEKLKKNNYKSILNKIGYDRGGMVDEFISIKDTPDKKKQSEKLELLKIKYPNNASAYFLKGIIEREKKNYLDAIDQYSKGLNINPDYSNAYYDRGVCYLNLKNHEKAVDDFTKAINFSIDFTLAYFYRGICYIELGKNDLAEKDFSTLLKLEPKILNDPDFSIFRNKIAAEKKLRDNQNDATAYYDRAKYYIENRDFERAMEDLNKAIKIYPKFVDAFFEKGNVYAILKDYNLAIKEYSRALKHKSGLKEAYFNRGLCYYYMSNYKKAIKNFDKAIKLDNKYYKSFNFRGACYYELKDYKSAMNDFSTSIRSEPSYLPPYFNRGNLHYDLKEYELALIDYSEIEEIYLKQYKETLINFQLQMAKKYLNLIKKSHGIIHATYAGTLIKLLGDIKHILLRYFQEYNQILWTKD